MTKKQVNKALISLTDSIINDLLEKISDLDISDDEKENIKSIISSCNTKKLRSPPKIPLEKQCSEICKNGSKCTVPICHKNTCWAHMTKDQRDEYRIIKNSK